MTEQPVTARLWDKGRALQARVKRFFDPPLAPGAAPLELLEAALAELESKVQVAGRGVKVFPYNRVIVHVAAAGSDRASIEAVFARLESRLRERLAEVRCEAPARLDVVMSFDDPRPDDERILSLECFRDTGAPETPPRDGCPPLIVTIVRGQCARSEYRFAEPVIAIGRTEDPVDAHGRVRRNHVAFADVRDGVTETVARAHARLEFDRGSGDYLLFNETASNPTYVLRGGRSIRVPPKDPRGFRLHPGDEIQLGRAVIRVSAE